MNQWETADCEALLLSLFKRGVIEKDRQAASYVVTADTKAHLHGAFKIAVPKPAESLSQPRVTASTHDDEWVYSVPSFDCTEWFEQADDDGIQALIECGFGGDYGSDDVAIFFDGKIDAVTEMFAHKRHGFECRVDETEAWLWLAAHKPHLFSEYNGDQTIVFPRVVSDQMTEMTT